VLDAMAQSKAAIEAGVLVNTIFCGDPDQQVAEGWRHVAKLADGKFAAIEHDKAVVIETPFDAQLAELSTKLNATYVGYGANWGASLANQAAQDGNAASLNPAAAAQRCQTKAGGLYGCSSWDLVDACKDPKFDLATVEKKDLPEDLQKLTTAELKEHIATKGVERAALQQQVAEIGKQRDAYVVAEQQKLGEGGDKLFEQAVLESVRQQAESRGFLRRAEAQPEPAPEAAPAPIDPKFEQVIEKAAEGYEKFVGALRARLNRLP
jgi:hypothetical protein